MQRRKDGGGRRIRRGGRRGCSVWGEGGGEHGGKVDRWKIKSVIRKKIRKWLANVTEFLKGRNPVFKSKIGKDIGFINSSDILRKFFLSSSTICL